MCLLWRLICSLYAQAMDLVLGASLEGRTSFDFCSGVHNTYFVPTDYAFRKLGAVELHRLFSNPTRMRQILDNHQTDRILPSALIGTRRQYEIKTKNEIVRVSNEDDKFMVWPFIINNKTRLLPLEFTIYLE